MSEVYVLPKWTKKFPSGAAVIDTTSSSGKFRELSPFILGPISLYPRMFVSSQNFENLWQFSKVYPGQTFDSLNEKEIPNTDWYKWHYEGLRNPRAIRYPMGKGAKPLYSWWGLQKLDYITARKRIYATIYARFVQETDSYRRLEALYQTQDLVLLDYDAYNHHALNRSLKDVINDPDKKMGHAFVLDMMLTGVLADCLKE